MSMKIRNTNRKKNDKMIVQAFNVNLLLFTFLLHITWISWNENGPEQKLHIMHSYVLFFFMPTAFNFSSVKQSTTINGMSWFVHGNKWQL